MAEEEKERKELPVEEYEDDSDASDTDSETDDLWRLGFVQPPEVPEALEAKYFPSKVGGRPAWLDPSRLPTADQLHCKAAPVGIECGKPLGFLMQIYAPVMDGPPEAFHRSLFVFCCRDADCAGKEGSVRVLRCQLSRKNPHYPFDPPDYPKPEAKITEVDEETPEPAKGDEHAGLQTDRKSAAVDPAEMQEKLAKATVVKKEGNDFFASGKLDEALSKYCAALELLGESLREGGATEAREEYAKLRSNRAECFLQQKKFTEATEECTAALEADQSCAKAWFRRAKARFALAVTPGPRSIGAAQDARSDLKKFLELDPDNDAGRRLMREVRTECGKAYVLEEQELDVMEEGSDYGEDSDNEELAAHVQKLMDDYEKNQKSKTATSKEDEEDDKHQLGQVGKDGSGKVDPEMLRFKQRTQRYKEQCLRYCFSPTARPLLLHSSFSPPNPPTPCSLCGAPRHFEFQVMPQLLFFLKAESDGRGGEKELELEFGTVLVYSCSNTCTPPDSLPSAYVEEVVAIQRPVA